MGFPFISTLICFTIRTFRLSQGGLFSQWEKEQYFFRRP